MDLATRTLDLSRAILDILNKENSVRDAAGEILEWLGRERIDKQEYQYCVEALSAQAFPNARGLDIQHQVRSSEQKVSSVAGLKLKLSTSIGRWMLSDPNLVYVVTTVAVCMMYHDMEYAVEVLCNFALDQGGHEEGVSYPRNPYRMRLKPVVTKFVDSVALNIVNTGHDFNSALPSALNGICSHPLEAPQLSAIIKVVAQAQSDIFITSDLFPGDLVMWLMTHFHGILEISLNGKVILEEDSGTDSVRVIFAINNRCSTCPNRDGDLKNSNIKVATIVKGKLTTLIDESHCFYRESKSSTRQELYETGLLADTRRAQLSRNEVAELRIAARSLLRWLLGLELRISDTARIFIVSKSGDGGFARNPAADGFICKPLEDLLAGFPTVLNKNWGDAKGSDSRAIYEEPQPSLEQETEGLSMSMHEIMQCFPIAMSLFDTVQQRCRCRHCGQGRTLGTGSWGCLRESALDELLLLITHGIAEAFCATNVSGLSDQEHIREAIRQIFSEIIVHSTIQWDRWFHLVALVYLGGNLKIVAPWNGRFIFGEDTTSVVAYQRGSLVIAAPWLDLTVDLSSHRVFAAAFGNGQIRGINSEEATIELESCMSVDVLKEFKCYTPSNEELAQLDDGKCMVESALMSKGEGSYRLLTMLRSESYRRIIDPSDTILGLFRSSYPRCSHPHPMKKPILKDGKQFHLATFDHAVGGFSVDPLDFNHLPRLPDTIQVTKLLDTTLKFNVTLGLVSEGPVVADRCCLSCACDETGRVEGKQPCIVRRAHATSGSRELRKVGYPPSGNTAK
nr:hypothetical protein FVER53263_06539 [Fusarium verticillioides]